VFLFIDLPPIQSCEDHLQNQQGAMKLEEFI